MAYNPPIGSIYHLYTTYILPSGGLYATYHLLGEPETTIDFGEDQNISGEQNNIWQARQCAMKCVSAIDPLNMSKLIAKR